MPAGEKASSSLAGCCRPGGRAGGAQTARRGGEPGGRAVRAHQPAGARCEGEPENTTASAGLPATTRPQPGCGARVVAAAGPGVPAKANATDTYKASVACSCKGRPADSTTAFFQDASNSSHCDCSFLSSSYRDMEYYSLLICGADVFYFSLKRKEKKKAILFLAFSSVTVLTIQNMLGLYGLFIT